MGRDNDAALTGLLLVSVAVVVAFMANTLLGASSPARATPSPASGSATVSPMIGVDAWVLMLSIGLPVAAVVAVVGGLLLLQKAD